MRDIDKLKKIFSVDRVNIMNQVLGKYRIELDDGYIFTRELKQLLELGYVVTFVGKFAIYVKKLSKTYVNRIVRA